MFLSGLETVDKAHSTAGELACQLASHPGCGHLEKPPTPEDTTMVTEEEEGPGQKAGTLLYVESRPS